MTGFSILWLVIGIAAAAIEAATAAMVSLWFVAGAVAARIFSIAVDSFFLQLCVFLFVSAASLALFRNKFIGKIRKKTPTNTDRIIGKEARVTERIDNLKDTGVVTIEGLEWTARAENDKNIYEKDEMVTVAEITGAKVIVK